ncbi:uncharacterized protein KRP23_14320 [Phytophthora ramorum]|uniref:uncharacterized protein n=1 Tax=Phytophthora ramorum TaxID=164328 RepID=UPI0030B79B2A|nr:hypothetical protein KRP23_14320 [Phytophthora ramorum]
MAKRSSTLKQFLLRVHPDHFHNIPKVHDENLQSVKLLNQFIDEHYAPQGGGSSIGWRGLGSPREKVYFSVMVPSLSVKATDKEAKKLKRFSMELAANIEAKMIAVLRECGVVVPESEEEVSGADSQQRRTKKMVERRRDDWQNGWTRPSGMDFGGFTMGEMYAKANRAAAASASRRRKKPIQTLQGLLEFMREDETMEMQERRQIAWNSIQSTLRKYTRANKQGLFTPKDFLRGATIDISANPSGIDFSNEYRIGLNPADVPVQWVQVLETIDANMVLFMRAAREGLASLQTDATAALGEANISRGHTCSALGYRTFLQSMRQRDADYRDSEQGLLEKFTLVIEDDSYEWRVLETGQVRAPFTSSYGEAVTFLSKSRAQIRHQQEAHNANLEAFAYISSRCADAMRMKVITHDEGIPVADAIAACEELLKSVVGLTPQSSRGSIPHEMVRFLDTYTQGRCMLRSDVKRYASFALRLQQELAREKQKQEEQDKGKSILDEEGARFPVFNEKYTEPSGTFVWDKRVDKARQEHVAWSRKIDLVVQMLDGRNGGEKMREKRSNQLDESVENVIREIVSFLQQQKHFITELGRENIKLRDMVHARPTRRELVTLQLEVERLQWHVQKLRIRPKDASNVHERENGSVEGATGKMPSLSERIVEEKLLQSLRVRTERNRCIGACWSNLFRYCGLVLLRVGGCYSIRANSTAETLCHEALDLILSHVNDVLVELDARREQMKPPGSKAHEILLKSMKLLQVARIDELAPTVRCLIDNMKAEQEFQRDLRELFGLDEAATRKQILKVATILFGELGFLTGNAPFRRNSTTPPRHPHESSRSK